MGKLVFCVMREKRKGTADDDLVQAIVAGYDADTWLFEIGYITKVKTLKFDGWRPTVVNEWHAVFHVKCPYDRVRIGKKTSSYEEAQEYMVSIAKHMADTFGDTEPTAPRDAL